MTDRFRDIYNHQAEAYERLAAREDQAGNLFAALNEIRWMDGVDVVEFGAGTGRVTRLLSVMVNRIYAFDIAAAMLAQARAGMETSGMTNWTISCGDNCRMPVAADSADVVIEGWSFGHVMGWYPQRWQECADAMLAEMERIVRPGGEAILIETMGTGQRRPQPPTDALAALYAYWQEEHGFEYRWIRTDYQFASLEEADELIRGFFGDEMADKVLGAGKVIVPECTGIWWKTFNQGGLSARGAV